MLSDLDPAKGKTFDKWISSSNDLNIASSTSTTTTIVMPGHDVAMIATYKDTSTNGNTSQGGSNVTVSGNGGSNSGNSGNGSTNKESNSTGTKEGGTVVSITKPGFSDTDKASAKVHGSTDNYMIKITEDADAQAQVEAALLADGETSENISYFAMDISL